MIKGRALVLVCVLIFAALPATAQPEHPEPLGFDKIESTTSGTVQSQAVEPSFQIQTVFSGLSLPTVVRFSPDGRVFVAEKGGAVKVFDSLSDTTATPLALNISGEVYSYWDRGLLGMALHPNFPASPFIYLLYALDTRPYGDNCPTPPGPTTDGCMADGRLLKVQVSANNTVGTQTVLITGNWCQQFPSHSTGSLEVGPEGALYVSAGDGASFNVVDYGQLGGTLSGTPTPRNPCSDPSNEGGALRSQDARTSSDPLSFDGTVLRINPDTGAPWPGNPLHGGSNSADDAILAYGLRNPFRMTVANTGDVYVGDVGWGTWEEINRIPSGTFRNFGWPCYEGNGRQSGYDAANLPICETLYTTAGAVTSPLFTYQHGAALKSCPEVQGNSSAITGLAFYPGGPYPASYDGSLFFADYSRGCIWVMFLGSGGQPNPNNIIRFVNEEPSVGLYAGPGGDIFSIDHIGGRIRRFVYVGATNNPPIANATASPTSGSMPLTVNFSSAGSSDPDGDTLTYSWDLDEDGAFDDAFVPNPTFTYSAAGTYNARLRLDDGQGGIATSSPIVITVTTTTNSPPNATIVSPTSSLTWGVGQSISLSAAATDSGSTYNWTITIVHCSSNIPTDCHEHVETTLSGQSVAYVAPDHDYPSRLRFDLVVRDPEGLADQESVELLARSKTITVQTVPAGFPTTIGGVATGQAVVIENSFQSIAALTPQTAGGYTYQFRTWNDGTTTPNRAVTVVNDVTYTATYNGLPTADLAASTLAGPPGTTVNFTATGADVDGTFIIAWDTDNDGLFDDGTGTTRSITYPSKGNFIVRILVTDNFGATATDSVTVQIKPGKGGGRR